jgi:8-amino-7-oxononanoate synthase
MNPFDDELLARLCSLDSQGLRRRLRRVDSPQQSLLQAEGRERVNFSSNDYLGLANHPVLKEAMIRAVERHGVGSGASRLVCGSLAPHHELEEALAAFKQTEAALSFASGYATAVGTIPALVGKDDFVITDKLVHACIIDAVRLSGATLRVFKHNDVEDLERLLRWAQAERESRSRAAGASVISPEPTPGDGQILVITESVFSMDGDLAPLRNVVELKERYGAWLMVDEAHATGLFGERRSGLLEAMGLAGRAEIQMGTLGKALGASGGYIAGSRALIDWLVNRARSFIFSTAPSPAAAAAAQAAVELVQSGEGELRRQRAWSQVNRLKETVIEAGWVLPPAQSTILPLIVGGEADALRLGQSLLEAGFWIPAIRYPTVARGKARLRFTVTADHTLEQINALGETLKTLRASWNLG